MITHTSVQNTIDEVEGLFMIGFFRRTFTDEGLARCSLSSRRGLAVQCGQSCDHAPCLGMIATPS
jgi:hypothetical protein